MAAQPLYLRKSSAFPIICKTLLRLCRRFSYGEQTQTSHFRLDRADPYLDPRALAFCRRANADDHYVDQLQPFCVSVLSSDLVFSRLGTFVCGVSLWNGQPTVVWQ